MTKTYAKLDVPNIREKLNSSVDESKERVVEIVRKLVEYIDINCTALRVNYENITGSFNLNCDFGKKSIDYGKLEKYIE